MKFDNSKELAFIIGKKVLSRIINKVTSCSLSTNKNEDLIIFL